MPVLSPKRQVTLPKELCDRLMVQPGDDLAFLEYDGRITIIKKLRGGSDGTLRHLKANTKYSDRESLLDALSRRPPTRPRKKRKP